MTTMVIFFTSILLRSYTPVHKVQDHTLTPLVFLIWWENISSFQVSPLLAEKLKNKLKKPSLRFKQQTSLPRKSNNALEECCVFRPAFGCLCASKSWSNYFFLPLSSFFVHFKPISVISRLKSTKNV